MTALGNRTGVTESNGDRVTWSYDKTYQLTREQRDGANSYDVTHTYDPAGNRLQKIEDGSRTTFTYDEANQLETSEDADGTITYEYDATGNLTTQNAPAGRTTNTWDSENRLILVEAPSNVVNTMTYCADGLRVEKQDGEGTSKFIWDDQNILLETDSSNITQAAYTLQPLEYGNLLSQRRDETSNFYHFDGLGSTSESTDIEELAKDSYTYRAYGKLVANVGDTVNPFLWAGQLGYYEDAELGQYYIRARHYEPLLARWLSEDPLGFVGSEWNLFGYVDSKPIIHTDPTGLRKLGGWQICKCIAATTAFSGSATACNLGSMPNCCLALSAFLYIFDNCRKKPLTTKAKKFREALETANLACIAGAASRIPWKKILSQAGSFIGL